MELRKTWKDLGEARAGFRRRVRLREVGKNWGKNWKGCGC